MPTLSFLNNDLGDSVKGIQNYFQDVYGSIKTIFNQNFVCALIAIGLQPVTNYRVWPNFYVTNQVVTMNLNTWNSLTQKLKILVELI